MNSKLPIGTIVNMITVTIGSLIGIGLQQLFSDDIKDIIFQAIGLGTVLIGIQMSLKLPDGYMLVFIFSLIIGGVLGELIGIQDVLNSFGDMLKNALEISDANFTEGMVTAFLLFCIGSMTIVGAIEEGIQGKRELLYIKSMLDGISSIALASSFGIGIIFSIFPMLLFQGGITLLAKRLQHLFTEKLIALLSAVGGILIVAIAINILQLGTINVQNLLPALQIVILLAFINDKIIASRTKDI